MYSTFRKSLNKCLMSGHALRLQPPYTKHSSLCIHLVMSMCVCICAFASVCKCMHPHAFAFTVITCIACVHASVSACVCLRASVFICIRLHTEQTSRRVQMQMDLCIWTHLCSRTFRMYYSCYGDRKAVNNVY